MRKLLGGVVLVAGIGGLGWWATATHAHRIENQISKWAGAIAGTAVHGVNTQVSGRDIVVTGLADGPAERERLLGELHQVDGQREVIDRLNVLPSVRPFTISADRTSEGLVLAGHVPTEAARATVADLFGVSADALQLAAGAPKGDWLQAVSTGQRALGLLKTGQMSLSGAALSLTGQALGPGEKAAAEAVLAGLPDGFSAQTSIEMLDDGTPPAFDIRYEAATGARVSGKLPPDMAPGDVARLLGLKVVTGDARPGLTKARADLRPELQQVAGWLPEFEAMSLRVVDDTVSLTGELLPGVDKELVQQNLEAILGKGRIKLLPLQSLPAEGTQRLNKATGRAETFASGFWLPNVAFDVNAAACEAEVNSVLALERINFVTGSARLDGRSVRAVNAMASVMRLCALNADLQAVLGGHTDDQGSEDLNLSLSQSRAEAVRLALIARGVPAAKLTALGYGASQPIADNSTEEGRAANRRTTVSWTN